MPKDLSDEEFVDRLVAAGWKRWEAERELQDIAEELESGYEPTNHETNTTMNELAVEVAIERYEKQIAQLTKERDELKSKLHQSDLNFDALERQNKHLLTEQSHEENTRKLLQHQMEQAQQERDQLAAKVEEMRQVLGWAYGWLGCEDCSTTEQCEECKDMGAAIDHALSDQCGVGWLSPDKKKVLVEAGNMMLNQFAVEEWQFDAEKKATTAWKQALEAAQ